MNVLLCLSFLPDHLVALYRKIGFRVVSISIGIETIEEAVNGLVVHFCRLIGRRVFQYSFYTIVYTAFQPELVAIAYLQEPFVLKVRQLSLIVHNYIGDQDEVVAIGQLFKFAP